MWLNRIKTPTHRGISQKAGRRKVYLHLSQFTFFKEQKQWQSQQEGKRRKVIKLPRIAAAAFSWNYFATRAPRAPRLKLSRAIVCSQLGWSAQIRPQYCVRLFVCILNIYLVHLALCLIFFPLFFIPLMESAEIYTPKQNVYVFILTALTQTIASKVGRRLAWIHSTAPGQRATTLLNTWIGFVAFLRMPVL